MENLSAHETMNFAKNLKKPEQKEIREKLKALEKFSAQEAANELSLIKKNLNSDSPMNLLYFLEMKYKEKLLLILDREGELKSVHSDQYRTKIEDNAEFKFSTKDLQLDIPVAEKQKMFQQVWNEIERMLV